jgi:hypothetical protein
VASPVGQIQKPIRLRLLTKVNGSVAKSTSLDSHAVHEAVGYPKLRRRIAVLGHDDTSVISASPIGSESRQPTIERLRSGAELHVSNRAAADGNPAITCNTQGAMSLQSSDAAHGHESVPQKLLHLVGYRDPHACPAARHPPRRSGTG